MLTTADRLHADATIALIGEMTILVAQPPGRSLQIAG
jgi:hypothetical protein